MKIVTLLFGLILLIHSSVSYSQKGDSRKPKANTKINENPKPKADLGLTDEQLRKELSGKYEGKLEVPLCCDSYDYNNGFVYFDLTKSPITIIYSGVIYDTNYYYEDKKIFIKYDGYSGNPLIGWFEKQNGNWVYWQRFDGYEDDGLTDKKPGFVTKKSNLETCLYEIDSYFSEQRIFKNFLETFKQAIINSDYEYLDNRILFPIQDGTGFYRENFKLSEEISSSKEFCKRIKLYLDNNHNSLEDYFSKPIKEMEANVDYPGAYFIYGSFNLIFDKVNGEYKLVRFASWG